MDCANGHSNDDSANFCVDCGLPLVASPSSKTCPDGHENAPSAAFCSTCGKALGERRVIPPPPSTPPGPASGQAPKAPRRVAILAVLALLLVVGVGIGLIAALSGDSDDSDDRAGSDASDSPSLHDAFDDYEPDLGDYDLGYSDPQGDYDKTTDSYTMPSGIVVKSPGSYALLEGTFTVKVVNESGGAVTPYFQIRMVNEAETRIFATWDCYGDSLDPGVTQRVDCFGDGVNPHGYIVMVDESVSY